VWLKGYFLKLCGSFPLRSIYLSKTIGGQHRQGMSPGMLMLILKNPPSFTSDESWYK